MPVSQGGESSPGGGGDGRWLWSRCDHPRVRSSSASSRTRFEQECSSSSASAWSKSRPALGSSRRRRNGWHSSGSTQSKTVNLERLNTWASGGSRISRPVERLVHFRPHNTPPYARTPTLVSTALRATDQVRLGPPRIRFCCVVMWEREAPILPMRSPPHIGAARRLQGG
jgi:hypothetical protein